jgi:hypothetical protein
MKRPRFHWPQRAGKRHGYLVTTRAQQTPSTLLLFGAQLLFNARLTLAFLGGRKRRNERGN